MRHFRGRSRARRFAAAAGYFSGMEAEMKLARFRLEQATPDAFVFSTRLTVGWELILPAVRREHRH
jgi:hypothetical protein